MKVLVATVFLIGAAIAKPRAAEFPSFDFKIINGDDAELGQFPWQVSLQVGSRHNCGGSILSADRVATAAHCVEFQNPSNLRIVAGSTTYSGVNNEETVQIRQVASLDYDDSWDTPAFNWDYAILYLDEPLELNEYVSAIELGTMDDDGIVAGSTTYSGVNNEETVQIRQVASLDYDDSWDTPAFNWDYAILYLDEPLELNEYVSAIELGTMDDDGVVSLRCTASGWGYENQNQVTPLDLKFADMTALSNADCRSGLTGIDHNPDCHLCSRTSGTSICFGDSGGPLVCWEGDTPRLYGIASFVYSAGGQICVDNYPSGWARQLLVMRALTMRLAYIPLGLP
ncbi:unnamed protein product [Cyprideis torosa]|uniref:Uncharacterized protein n=1 Tax=Cyprideis torosa TaxID=163714 RepID=A0A7R8W5L4_9CRUS|nr:unnamed protein product [Cyprideis torosa]CAG0885429.1 unnamed protein product [Cyprideis torosa]